MAAEKTTATTDIEVASNKDENAALATREDTQYMSPPVDIYETDEGLIVLADLPGAANDDVDIRVEDGLLTIKGKTNYEMRADSIRDEFRLTNFFRQFKLGNEVNQEKISAGVKNGVLTINLPKAEKVKPRRIAVNVG
jgi:HSP20 family molecular chaperone IbpA